VSSTDMLARMGPDNAQPGGTPRGRDSGSKGRGQAGARSGSAPRGDRDNWARTGSRQVTNSRQGTDRRAGANSQVGTRSRPGTDRRAGPDSQYGTSSRAVRSQEFGGSGAPRAGTPRQAGRGGPERFAGGSPRSGQPGRPRLDGRPFRAPRPGEDGAGRRPRDNDGELTRSATWNPRPGDRFGGRSGRASSSSASARPFGQSQRPRTGSATRATSGGGQRTNMSPDRNPRPRPYSDRDAPHGQFTASGPRWGRSVAPGERRSVAPGERRSLAPGEKGSRGGPSRRADTYGSRASIRGGQPERDSFNRDREFGRAPRPYRGRDDERTFPQRAGRPSGSADRYAGPRDRSEPESGWQGSDGRRSNEKAPGYGGRPRDGRPARGEGYSSERDRGRGRDFGRDSDSRAWRPAPRRTLPKGWGSVTRHGVRELDYDGASASEIWSQARDPARAGSETPSGAAPRKPGPDSWTYEPSSTSDAGGWAATLVETVPASPRVRAGSKSPGPRARTTKDRVVPRKRESAPRSAFPQHSAKSEGLDHRVGALLGDAARAYSADRYQDALRILRRLSAQAPKSASVKELLGLTLYRLGRWPLAVKELEAHHELSGSYDQFPVIADSYRAMRRYAEADEVWTELRQASPSAEVVAEGRLVAAGCLADQDDLSGAVRLLESSLRHSKPKSLHLRQWYALADLYERAGELPRARELFSQIADVDPGAYDVRQRLIGLG
jgi:tetratricopeptide (TPR) repeat protein